jgi:hypothetical protein
MSKQKNSLIDKAAQKVTYFGVALVVAVATLTPLLLSPHANAAQITGRKLTIGSGVPSAVTTYAFDFTVPTTGTIVKSLAADACTTAVGTCTTPSGFSVTGVTLTGQPTGLGDASGWTVNTSTTGSLRLANSSDATTPSGAQHVSFSGVTNPSTVNTSFFLRITTYSDGSWTTPIDTGTTASAVVQTLTVNAAVAEVLNFCVGSTTVNDATSSPGADCTAIGGTSLNIGTLDTGSTNVSPVNTNGGDNKNGVAMIRTNAASGAVVSYDSIQQSGTNQLGTLRISGANCNASSSTLTDQCIRAKGTTQGTIAAGTENFGMTIGAVNCGSVSSYTCTFSSGAYNLQRDTNYDGNGTNTFTTDSGAVGGTTNQGYAWDDSGTAQNIASSAASTTKVIDDEAMILKFAATPSITTPFGLYAAQADFIAVPTY